MPNYQYQCEKHGYFTVDKKMVESATWEFCPECGGLTTRVYSVGGVSGCMDGPRGATRAPGVTS